MDSGASSNFIWPSIARKAGLIPKEVEETFFTFDNQPFTTRQAYEVDCEVMDSLGKTKVTTQIFYAADVKGYPMVFGMSYLQSQGCGYYDFANNRWAYADAWEDFLEILDADSFDEACEGDPNSIPTALFVEKTECCCPRNWSSCECTGESFSVSFSAPSVGSTGKDPSTLPAFLKGYEDVFDPVEAAKLADQGGFEHAIETTGPPPFGPLYNLSGPQLKALRDYIEDALKKGWIRHSVSPAGAPILFVPKKDGGLRLCVDYRGLNKVTIKNRHPLPLIDETLDRLTGAEMLTKVDLKDAYHRIRIKGEDVWKTAFRTRYGHFEYLVLPFGLTNAPATFQSYINRAMAGLLDNFVVVYLDDILIYSKKGEDHEDHVRQVLERLRKHKLYAKLSKCEFCVKRVEYLGFIVTAEGVEPDPARVDTVAKWPTPKSFREIQVFLGFANFYRRFIARYSHVASGMTDMLVGMEKGKKSGPFHWTDAAEKSFQKLKACFQEAPLLVHFDPTKQCRVETDASTKAIAGTISQQVSSPDGTKKHWHPIAFWSRKLQPAERNYTTHDQELLAIVDCFKEWRHYLEGSQHTTQVLTDHNNLRYFMNAKYLEQRQARWAMYLAGYDFEIHYRKGTANPADAPSRRPDYDESDGPQDLAWLPTFQNKLKGSFAVEWMKDKGGLDGEHSPETSFGQPHHDGEGLLRYDSVGTFAAANSWAPGQECQISHGEEVIENECVYLACGCRGRYDIQAAGNRLGPVRDPVGMTPTADRYPFVRGLDGCKHLVPRKWLLAALSGATAYVPRQESILDVIRRLQTQDAHGVRFRSQQGKRDASGQVEWSEAEGLLYREGRLFVPNDRATRQELLRLHHDDPLAGHFGADKTSEMLRRTYYWENMEEDIRTYVRECDVCQRVKVPRRKPYGLLQSLPRPKGPWKEISMDFITGLPACKDKRGGADFDAVLVVVDRYSKMSRYIPCHKTITAPQLAERLWESVFSLFGTPDGIVSDRGTVFTSQFWSAFCHYLYIERRLSTAYHPQTDGQTERQNQILEQYLRSYCNRWRNDWVGKLPFAEFTYNNSKHTVLHDSPFHVVYGYHPNLPWNSTEPEGRLTGEVPAAKQRAETLKLMRMKLQKLWDQAQGNSKKYYDKHHIDKHFALDEWVLLSTKNIHFKIGKLAPKFIGPFKITECIGEAAYRLELPSMYDRLHNVFNVNLLKEYHIRKGEGPESYGKGELPELAEDDEDQEWEVEAIVDDRKQGKRQIEYLIKWKDWPEDHNTWLKAYPYLENAKELVEEYRESHGLNEPSRKAHRTEEEADRTPRKRRRPRRKGR
jgi:transposase InsO family protein